MSDRFGGDYAIGDARITEFVTRIKSDHERTYYTALCMNAVQRPFW
ncbi:MAG: hypothetical protein IPP63_18950 [Chloracidobacterium sp.]|nr:hypothetical protein [Chloracidobacterium sp.]